MSDFENNVIDNEETKDDVFADFQDDEYAADESDGIHIHIPAPVVALAFATAVIGTGKVIIGTVRRIGSAIFGKKYAEVPPVRLKRDTEK